MQSNQMPGKLNISPGLLFAIAGGAGLLLLIIIIVIFVNDTTAGIFCSFVWVVFFIPILFRLLKRLITTSRVGLPEINLSSSSLRSGDPLVVNYQHVFKNAADLLQVTIQLILRESATRGSGTDKSTKRHNFIIQEIVMPGRHIEGGETFYTRQSLEIPPGVMHTFTGGDNSIQWEIKVKADLKGLPDFEETRPIQILPELSYS